MITTNEIHVIVPDNHSEGFGEPIAAFADKDTADAAVLMLSGTAYRSYKVLPVPVWPGGLIALLNAKRAEGG